MFKRTIREHTRIRRKIEMTVCQLVNMMYFYLKLFISFSQLSLLFIYIFS